MKNLKWNMLLLSALYVVLGLVLLFWPEMVLGAICILIGGLVAGTGVFQLVRFFVARERLLFAPLTLITGLISLGLGVFLLLRSDVILTALPLVFGLFVVFDSVVRLQNAWELRRVGISSWKGIFGMGMISVVLGLVVLFNPFATVQALVMGIGVILIVEGFMNLLSMGYTAFVMRKCQQATTEILSDLEDLTSFASMPDSSVTLEGTARELDPDDESKYE